MNPDDGFRRALLKLAQLTRRTKYYHPHSNLESLRISNSHTANPTFDQGFGFVIPLVGTGYDVYVKPSSRRRRQPEGGAPSFHPQPHNLPHLVHMELSLSFSTHVLLGFWDLVSLPTCFSALRVATLQIYNRQRISASGAECRNVEPMLATGAGNYNKGNQDPGPADLEMLLDGRGPSIVMRTRNSIRQLNRTFQPPRTRFGNSTRDQVIVSGRPWQLRVQSTVDSPLTGLP
jgi:hypothetical protein